MSLFKNLLRKLKFGSLHASDFTRVDEGDKYSNSPAVEALTRRHAGAPMTAIAEILAPLPESLVSASTIEISPPAKVYLDSALAYYHKGDYDQAITHLTEAIELAPGLAELHNERGCVYRKAGDLQRAIQDFNKAMELDPDLAVAFYNRGTTYYVSGDLGQAIQDFTRVIELDPSFAVAYNNRGIVHRMSGNPEQAIQDYNSAIEIAPNYADAYSNRGFAYAGSGHPERAIRDFGKAIELDPDHRLAYKHRGYAYYESGAFEQAIRDFNRALELSPKDALAYTYRGLAHQDSGNADMAYRDLLIAARIDPDEVDFTRLRLAYAKSSEYDPYNVNEGLALARKELGEVAKGDDPGRTIVAANKVLELNHLVLNAHMEAALAHLKNGDEEKAAYHQKFGRNWTKSILQSGDGSSFQTAFVVISLDEEYAMLPVLGALGRQQLQLQLQRLEIHEAHIFDIFEVRDEKTGKISEIYFNLDLIMRGVQEGRVELPDKHRLRSLGHI